MEICGEYICQMEIYKLHSRLTFQRKRQKICVNQKNIPKFIQRFCMPKDGSSGVIGKRNSM